MNDENGQPIGLAKKKKKKKKRKQRKTEYDTSM